MYATEDMYATEGQDRLAGGLKAALLSAGLPHIPPPTSPGAIEAKGAGPNTGFTTNLNPENKIISPDDAQQGKQGGEDNWSMSTEPPVDSYFAWQPTLADPFLHNTSQSYNELDADRAPFQYPVTDEDEECHDHLENLVADMLEVGYEIDAPPGLGSSPLSIGPRLSVPPPLTSQRPPSSLFAGWVAATSPAARPGLQGRLGLQAGPMEMPPMVTGLPDNDDEENRIHMFSKTRLCKFNQVGRCRKGLQCQFAHTDQERRAIPDLTKTSICSRWASRGCHLTARECRFAHGVEDLRVLIDPSPEDSGCDNAESISLMTLYNNVPAMQTRFSV